MYVLQENMNVQNTCDLTHATIIRQQHSLKKSCWKHEEVIQHLNLNYCNSRNELKNTINNHFLLLTWDDESSFELKIVWETNSVLLKLVTHCSCSWYRKWFVLRVEWLLTEWPSCMTISFLMICNTFFCAKAKFAAISAQVQLPFLVRS